MFVEFETSDFHEDHLCPACGYNAVQYFHIKDTRPDQISPGYGAYCLTWNDGVRQIGRFNRPLSDEEVKDLKAEVAASELAQMTYLSRVQDGKLEVLVGSLSAIEEKVDEDQE
jgi:hypothetical protein